MRFDLNKPVLEYQRAIYYGFDADRDEARFHGENLRFIDSMMEVPRGTTLRMMKAGR